MTNPVLVAVAGLSGAVGSTLAAGICAAHDENSRFGMATESRIIKQINPPFIGLESLILEGWDLDTSNLFETCLRHRICPIEALNLAQTNLQKIVPRPGVRCDESAIGDWISREAQHLLRLKKQKGARNTVIVNLCPTETPLAQQLAADTDWTNLRRLRGDPLLSVSAIYFRLAIEAQAHFVNFTPNIVETPSLCQLAEKTGSIYLGRDGKTGQTFLKTTLAPALRDKNLKIDGWFSTNLLGNSDGRGLAGTEAGRTKIESKSKSLASILGYTPGGEDSACHQVHIHYYPPRGDAKEAWDNIDFRGFLGVNMQMKINWLGKDSILAAPAILDLIRITDLAAQRGLRGPLDAASYFFKDPIVSGGHRAEHSVPEQYRMLLSFLGISNA